MNKLLAKLQGRRAEITAEMRTLHVTAADEDRGFSEEEQASYDGLTVAIEANTAAITRETTIREAERQLIPLDAGDDGAQLVALTDPNQQQADEQKWGSFGEFLGAVHGAAVARHPSEWDSRLTAPQAAITGLGEAVNSEGAFLVGTDFARELMMKTHSSNAILGASGYSGPTRIPISTNANSTKIPAIDETSRADGSRFGGVQAFWEAEAAQITSSKPKFRQISLDLKKLTGLAYATEEMLQDSATLEAIISKGFRDEFNFKIQDALINGLGSGLPMGILAAPCLVSVAKETGQAPASIVKENIDKMWSRMHPSGVPGSVWFINQNCYPSLFAMTLDVGTGGMPVYLPPGGLSASPYGTLMGRPVVPIEQCQTLGTKGDILYCDWEEYVYADKGTIDAATSIHIRFDYAETAFRFLYRADGQPAWNAPLTPYKGGSGSTTSPFISLATRA